MVGALRSWDFDDTTAWLRPVDLYLAEQLLGRVQRSAPTCSVLEIGVWKGAWLLQVVAAQPDVVGVGVDPYPGSPGMREQVCESAVSRGIADRTVLLPTTSDVCARLCHDGSHRSFALAHIDGLHVEEQVDDDLEFCARHTADDGVIIVDDYLHPAYPGIASAMFRFLADRSFAMFLTTGHKAYLCRAGTHAAWHSRAEQLLEKSGLAWVRYKGEHTGTRYVQRPDVRGFPVLLCLDEANDERVLAGLHRPAAHVARHIADRWIPTGFRDRVRPVRRRARHLLHPGRRTARGARREATPQR